MVKRSSAALVPLFLLLYLLGGASLPGRASDGAGPLGDAPARAMAHVRANAASLSVAPEDVAELLVTDHYFSEQSGLTMVYLQQALDGIPVHNALVNVALDRDGRVVHVGNRAIAGVAASATRGAPTLSPEEAVRAVAAALGLPAPRDLRRLAEGSGVERPVTLSTGGIAREPISAALRWQPTGGGVRLAWELSIETLDQQHGWQLRVDAATGELLDKNDWVIHDEWGSAERAVAQSAAPGEGASGGGVAPATRPMVADAYRVYPLPVESPNHTTPLPPADGRVLVTDPDDASASPFGWHDADGAPGPEFTITRGNNAHGYTDLDGDGLPDPGGSPSGGPGPLLTFDFPIDLTEPPSAYRPAAVTNLFYWSNVAHDLNYLYGFTEAAGNFQVNNYGRGGLGNDDVRAEAQDGSGTNGGIFFAPPDGQRPRMQMYVWTLTEPDRDGALDAGVILHEYGHGISLRLTGGPSNVSCLSNAEQGGEGWSDWQALVFTAQPSHSATTGRTLGTYLLGQPVSGPGIRTYPYSTDMAVNPHTYQDTRTAAGSHGVGEIWAAILWEGYWALVNEFGFEADFYEHASGAGNIRMMHLINEAMKLQPCSPGFVDARDAILAANQAIYSGEGQCLLWTAFAKRGLGANAVQGSPNSNADNTNGFALPPECALTPTATATVAPPTATATAIPSTATATVAPPADARLYLPLVVK